MSAPNVPVVNAKHKYRSVSSTVNPVLSKVEDVGNTRYRSKSEQKFKSNNENKLSSDNEDSEEASLFSFLGVELTRGYILEHDEEMYSARREKVYSFMKIPREVEKFMLYGFFQCADSFLFVYTFLPMRFLLAVWALITRPIQECFGFWACPYLNFIIKILGQVMMKGMNRRKSKRLLKPAEVCDLLKGSILVVCSALMFYVDTSMMYHLIKSQSVIKLYIFYNMLEVGDRLFSAFGQDTIDALFWTATEPRDRKREHLGVIAHHLFAIAYVFLHALLVLCQAMTLNVAINSNNKSLLTIMMSNNFVELKGSVFKKFDKNNLFQVACSDVRERFHLFVLLFIVVLQTMKEYTWKEEVLWVLVPDCLLVLVAETFVDWIKHAFITRFNELPVDVYRDYTLSLAYDMAQTRQKNAFTDHSDLVARRMGFIPLPLGVVMVRVLAQAVRVQGLPGCSLALLAVVCLASFRVLNNIAILGTACTLIDNHQQERQLATNHQSQSAAACKDCATSPTRPHAGSLHRSGTIACDTTAVTPSPPHQGERSNLGSPAIFSNSTVDITDVCLNEEMLRIGKLESIGEAESDLSKSEPNMQHEGGNVTPPSHPRSISPAPLTDKKRAESEPSIPHLIDAEQET